MSKKQKVWIAQLLCPQAHCILAAAGQCNDTRTMRRDIVQPLQDTVDMLILNNEMEPVCDMCGAGYNSWRVQVYNTKYKSIREAAPEVAAIQEAKLARRMN